MTRILLLGGTTEARRMADALAGMDAIYSLAGRTAQPLSMPIPMRIGGFGGPEGLADYLRREGITHVIDATHPFAARISANAHAACDALDLPLIRLIRPPWRGEGWLHVPDMAAAAAALPRDPARVFLAIGRMHLSEFAHLPHRWLLRLVDAPAAPPLPRANLVIDRGPFTVDGDLDLMRRHGMTHLVAKNSGGAGAEAKLHAARALGVQVVMIDRPVLPPRPQAAHPAEVLDWLHHAPADLGA
ncbi:cobalt-precorrin-6A reductase [Paracoccus zeaxanthinifaciens]|uniref:cobalt-precorrin-6A reductase n=1 Tax=Paracoccus zeaxanthinifaciens TaxID=187400 RepID=UPI0003B46E48|nr:cobalt-precorrin-6A reductase [Paracoccus zeaxanthinifaciens]